MYTMRKLTLEIIAAIALTIAAIIASAPGVRASDLTVKDAFARASITPAANSAAAYLTLVNQGNMPDRLIAIATPAARAAEPHRTSMAGDVMKMEAAGAIDLPPHAAVTMAPGGLHVMLMGLTAPLKEGSVIAMTLTFEKAGPLTITVPVKSAAALSP